MYKVFTDVGGKIIISCLLPVRKTIHWLKPMDYLHIHVQADNSSYNYHLAHDPPISFNFQQIRCKKRCIFSVLYFPRITLKWSHEQPVHLSRVISEMFLRLYSNKNMLPPSLFVRSDRTHDKKEKWQTSQWNAGKYTQKNKWKILKFFWPI